jgi:hypothetical protein
LRFRHSARPGRGAVLTDLESVRRWIERSMECWKPP